MQILSVVGARPNFMKVAPLHRAFSAREGLTSRIVHTGQHYDARMSDVFFRQLEMPEPDVFLGIGSASHAQQTARIMTAFEEVVLGDGPAARPDLVLVVGDVNSTLACALVAAKLHIPVAHVEAGLRSGDRRMPEELNRLVTDTLSDLLFVTEESGLENLRREGVPGERVHFVGNVMIDSLVHFRSRAAESDVLDVLGAEERGYTLVTLHRPSNVDDPARLEEAVRLLERLTEMLPVIFPIHPRTRGRLEAAGLAERLDRLERLRLVEPQGYLEFLRLMDSAALVVTDSGGLQEETTYLGVPCLTVRENTERPVTVTVGTNRLMPLDAEAVGAAAEEVLARTSAHGSADGSVTGAGDGAGGRPAHTVPPLWDGRAAERIADVLEPWHHEHSATTHA